MRRLALLLVGLVAACGESSGPVPAAEYGESLFADPALSTSQFNGFSCRTCHATDGASEAPRVAVSLAGVVNRASWWGGQSPRLLDAVNTCLELFMRGQPLDAEDPRGKALYEYLVKLSPGGPEAAAPLTIVENVSPVPRGDPARGEKAYERACRTCHGAPHTGRGRLEHTVAIIPEASIGFALDVKAETSLVVVEKVRHGRFFGVGGTMPPFSREALSDADLGAIVAYLGL